MIKPSKAAKRELWALFCGRILGQGVARTVYEHNLDGGLVVKVEYGAGSFQNVIEWETWREVEHTEHARWFAPCVAISPCGTVLIQRRTVQPREYPDRIPNYFTDLKLTNYGVLKPRDGEGGEERFVCHDYGMTRLVGLGLTRRMQTPEWWHLPG